MTTITKKRIHKTIKIILIGFASLLFIGIALLLFYFYQCTHYYDKEAKQITKAGFFEKQATTTSGNVINYAEGPDNVSRVTWYTRV